MVSFPKMFRAGAIIVIVILLLSVGCATTGIHDLILSRLYFGLSSPKGDISHEDFDGFVANEITPRFPDGLTRYKARGQWKNKEGTIVQEGTEVVEIVHQNSGADERLVH